MESNGGLTLPLIGEIPDGWSVYQVREILQEPTRNGIYKKPEFHGSGCKIVNMGELFAHPRLWNVDMRRLELSDVELERFRIQPGDLLFARRSLVAEGAGKCSLVCEVEEPTVFESSIIRARPDESMVDPRYLFYVFQSQYGAYALDTIRRQVAVAGITGSDLSNLSVPVPPLSEQHSIARVLEAFDRKIELNRRMNETLEGIARATFKSWFVDFDPVRAKMEGRQPFGMDAEIAGLFPGVLEEFSAGLIPAGWRWASIAEIATYVNGRNFTKDATGFGRMVIRIAELNSGPGASTVFNDVHAESNNVAEPDDILFAWSGSLGVYRWHRDEALINQHIFKVICDEFPPWFLFYELQECMDYFREIASHKATTMGHIKRSHLDEVMVAIPAKKLLAAANRIIGPTYRKIHVLERESQTLAALRDTLIPKLISGEIRLKDGERMAEVAAGI